MSEERVPPMLSLAAQYEILRELGRGGTAVVYLARERATGADVAIKLIHARYAQDADTVARFAREAEFVTRLNHPNVVPLHAVLDLGEAGTALVMAHVAGRTLKQAIFDDGPFPPERAERIMRDVVAALGATHALGIVHRDVKPENIFVDESGRALLADFGVARSMSNETHQLTMHGVAIGTPTYMAPEQIDGVELDGRGDIYSLGLVAWEMLTGRRPWDGEALYSVLYHQKHVPLPDVRRLRDDVPEHLAVAIDGATAKERESRWQNVDELLAALDGDPPARRPSTVLPASTETVRLPRPMELAALPATPEPVSPEPVSPEPVSPESMSLVATSDVAPAVPAALLEAMYLESLPRRVTPSRRVVVAGALVSLLALFLLFRGVQAWSNGAEQQREFERAAASAGTPSVSAGELAGTATGQPSPAAPALGGDTSRADMPVGVAMGTVGTVVPAPASTPEAPRPANRDTQRAAPGATAPPAMPAPLQPGVITSASATRDTPALTEASARGGTRIIPGGRHTCLLTADGRGFCWGGNDRGQLGIGPSARAATPALIGAEQRFSVIAPGLSHSCAVDVEEAAWCWGENDRGQLGDGSTASRAAPTRVSGTRRFRTVSAGASHSCALDSDGAAWCWGANGFGQVGDGEARDRTAPSPVATSRRFVRLAAGWNFTCALDDEGRAFCWGDDSAGQLGDGGTTGRRAPVGVQGRIAFNSITAGSAHACGITSGGDAFCWGANASGQLGDGTTTDRTAPTRVSGPTSFVAVTAGAVHSCGLTAEGEAFCWGRNTYGQLGDGGTDDHPLPVRVSGGHVFTSLRAFGSHTCGATASGEAFCWGYNMDGQLGDGTRTHRTRPVYVERPGAK